MLWYTVYTLGQYSREKDRHTGLRIRIAHSIRLCLRHHGIKTGTGGSIDPLWGGWRCKTHGVENL